MCNDTFVAGFFYGWLVTAALILAALIFNRRCRTAGVSVLDHQTFSQQTSSRGGGVTK